MWLLLQVWIKAWSFSSPRHHWEEIWVPTSDFSSLLLTSLILDESSQYRNTSKKSQNQNLTPNVQSNFRHLSGHLSDVMAQDLNRLHPHGQGHITAHDSQMLKRDYLGKVTTNSTLEPSVAFRVFTRQKFQQQEPSLESYYNPHGYSLRGWGLLWYMALTRAQIQNNALDISYKLIFPCDHWQLSEILTTSSLPIRLISSSLVMPSMRSESTLFPIKLAIEHWVHPKSNVSMRCCAMSGIHLQGLFIIILTIICLSTGSARWMTCIQQQATSSKMTLDSPLTSRQNSFLGFKALSSSTTFWKRRCSSSKVKITTLTPTGTLMIS